MANMDRSISRIWRSRPDLETVSEVLEFPVPALFLNVLQILFDLADGDPTRCVDLFEECLGVSPAGPSMSYHQTPPELFPIATMGVDGVHYGYVIHEPQLQGGDYPLGEICPMDFEGVSLVGSNTREGLESLISFRVEAYQDKIPAAIRVVAAKLNLRISPEQARRRRYDEKGQGRPIKPEVPPRWHFMSSSEGIGVLAPKDLFGGSPHSEIAFRTPTEEILQWAEQARAKGFLADALWALREGYWHQWTDPNSLRDISAEMVNVYDDLGRTQLGRKTRRRAEQFAK